MWLTGLPGAGKTAIARAAEERLRRQGRRVAVLDGDAIGEIPSGGPGSGPEEHEARVRRVGMAAEVLARNGFLALVPLAAPDTLTREVVRLRHDLALTSYLEVHVAAPARNVKAWHARRANRPDDRCEAADLRIEARRRDVSESAAALCDLLVDRGLA